MKQLISLLYPFSISSLQQSTLGKLSQLAAEEELVIAPLTSGNWGLDQALETHLDICCILLQVHSVSLACREPCVHIKKALSCFLRILKNAPNVSSADKNDRLQPVEAGAAAGNGSAG